MTDPHRTHPGCEDMPCATCAGLDPLHETSTRIAKLGWSVTVVGASPGYAYSVGLAAQGLPELIAEETPQWPLFDAASLVNRLARAGTAREVVLADGQMLTDPDEATRPVLLSRYTGPHRLAIAARFAPFGFQTLAATFL